MATKKAEVEGSGTQKWRDLEQQIIDAIDVVGTYKRAGVKFSSEVVSPSGWVSCHGFEGTDSRASARVSVMTGRYQDFRQPGSPSVSLWDFLAQHVPAFGGDWRKAREVIAKEAGVSLGRKNAADIRWYESISPTSSPTNIHFTARRRGLDEVIMRKMGFFSAQYPRGSGQAVTAIWLFGGLGLESEPTGFTCLPVHADKLQIYKGPDAPPEDVSMITKYRPGMGGGLFNNIGFDLIQSGDAQEVAVVEGISDCITAEAHRPDHDKLAILGIPGASTQPHPSWMRLFEGKVVHIIGDRDDAGLRFSSLWTAKILQVAKEVRNIELPYPATEKHGKDLRDFFQEGRNWDDFRALLNSTPSAAAEAPPAQDSTGHQLPTTNESAMLQALGLQVLGEMEGRSSIRVYHEDSHKIRDIPNINNLSYEFLVQLCGERAMRLVVPGNSPPPGCFSLRAVKMAVACEAQQRTISRESILGKGIWADTEARKLFLVRPGEVLTLHEDGSHEITRSGVSYDRVFNLSGEGSYDWFNVHDELDRLEEYKNLSLCSGAFVECAEILSRWNWRRHVDPLLATALIAATWLQTIWTFRPHIGVSAESESGKSYLFSEFLRRVFGDMSIYTADATAAGLRQRIRNDTVWVGVDEFENSATRKAVLELLRWSSSGAEALRGTAGEQEGASFRLNHMFWLASTDLGLKHQQDLNRFITFDLRGLEGSQKAGFLPSAQILRSLGERLRAAAVAHAWRIFDTVESLRGTPIENIPRRIVSLYSIPASILAVIMGHDPLDTLKACLEDLDFSEEGIPEHQVLKHEISEHPIRIQESSGRWGEIIIARAALRAAASATDDAAHEALENLGAAIVRKHSQGMFQKHLFIRATAVTEKILRGNSRFEGVSATRMLCRNEGVTSGMARVNGIPMHGVFFALETLKRHQERYELDFSDEAVPDGE